MLGAELTVSHRTPSPTNLGYGHVLFISLGHNLFGSLLVTILTGGVSPCILSPLPNSFVSREISYWLRLIMVLWLKLMVPRQNQEPPVDAYTWLRYLARAGITVISHNPLWDYINVLSWHNLFLLREIRYWCQFGSGVMVNDLWCRSETESLLWMRTQDCATPRCWYQGLWSWSIVELHWCVLFRKPYPWNNFYVVCQVIKQHLSSLLDQKGNTTFMCGLISFDLDGDYTHTSSLYILCVKVKPWSFLVLRDNWLAINMEICFPCCWDAGVCSFALLFNPCISEPNLFILYEETNGQPDQMDFYPNAWPFACKCELSTLGLPMVLRGPAQCQR
jgi:hypothetical protein